MYPYRILSSPSSSSPRHAATRGPSPGASFSASSSATLARFCVARRIRIVAPRSRASRELSPRGLGDRDEGRHRRRERPSPRAARNVSTHMLSMLCRIFASDVSAFATLRLPPHAFAFGSIVEFGRHARAPIPAASSPRRGRRRPRLAASSLASPSLRRVHHVRQPVRAQDTRVQPREVHLRHPGSAPTNCFSPAPPKARETASTPAARATPRRRARCRRARGLWRVPPEARALVHGLENLPAASAAMARESPTLATNMRGGRRRAMTGWSPRRVPWVVRTPGARGVDARGIEHGALVARRARATKRAPQGPSPGCSSARTCADRDDMR